MTVWRDAPISIADDLFLVALDERTGKPRLHPRALSIGLAGALLAELNLLDHITLVGDQILVPPTSGVPVSAHHRRMVEQLAAEPEHPVPTWLAFFAQTAPDVVGSRLVARGFLRTETSRGVLRAKQTYQPTDESALTWRTMRLANLISKRDVRSWEDGFLVGLLDTTGLVQHVMWHGSQADLSNVPDIVESVVADPFFRLLLTQVSALIAAGVITQRK